MTTLQHFYSTTEAAALLNVTPNHAMKLCATGKLTATKWRGRWYIPKAAVLRRREEQRTAANPAICPRKRRCPRGGV